MSSSTSWLGKSTYGRKLSKPSHELPRWRSPEPMAASMIPSPIVQSTYGRPEHVPSPSVIIEKATPSQDRQHELEADLQFLLDAQAEGLVRGLEGDVAEDRSSAGSTTPTMRSARSASRPSARKSMRRQPGLRSARKGIYSSILALSALKEEELEEFDDQIRRNESTLEQIDAWESKQRGLQEAAKHVDSEEDTIRIQRLRQEGDALQVEINAVELQLMEMKSRHRKLLRQAAAVENSVQAKLSSYTSSLRLLEEDVQRFLSFAPEIASPPSASQIGKESISQLPTKRRTLEMAKEFYREQRDSVIDQRKGIEHEKSALVEGAALWKDAVTEVSAFEKSLRGEMSALQSPQLNGAWDEPHQPSDSATRLKELINSMNALTSSLEDKLHHAESQNWNLLIAAIGAELDALKKGKQILEAVAGASAEGHLIDTNGHDGATHVSDDDGREILELDKNFSAARIAPVAGSVSDDDPDPDLLFSKHDTDGE